MSAGNGRILTRVSRGRVLTESRLQTVSIPIPAVSRFWSRFLSTLVETSPRLGHDSPYSANPLSRLWSRLLSITWQDSDQDDS